jgi:hypothetical protein
MKARTRRCRRARRGATEGFEAFGAAVEVDAGEVDPVDEVPVDEVLAPARAIPAVERTAAVVAVVMRVRSFMARASSQIVSGP